MHPERCDVKPADGSRCAGSSAWTRNNSASLRSTPSAMLPLLVLDTNVVLDAWWFADPAVATLVAAVEDGRVRWIATPAMHAEVVEVLDRPAFTGAPDAGRAVLAAFDAWAVIRKPVTVPAAPRCADPDDQAFVDLALAVGARWLVSRDRALLALAGPLRRWGVDVSAPGDWRATDAKR